jgi:hypothetical protein
MGNAFRKNVIVVGAGASKEFGLPTGAELTQSIAGIADIKFDVLGSKLENGDYKLVETLRLLAKKGTPKDQSINSFLHGAWQIRDNMNLAPSIDNFLDTHRTNAHLVAFGKIAIVHAIQKAEQSSYLFFGDGRPEDIFPRTKDTWLTAFFRILVSQRDFASFLEAMFNITFVSFNYDRCIYQFLHYAAIGYFNLNAEQIAQLHAALQVIYPYGSVGQFRSDSLRTGFGIIEYHEQLLESSLRIRTFTEGAESVEIERIRKAIHQSDVVVFLGFGFLPLNVDLLFSGEVFNGKKVIGTSKGLSMNSCQQIESGLSEYFPNVPFEPLGPIVDHNIELVNCTCANFFFEYQRFFTR